MIKRQYERTKTGYFNNFINSTDYTEKVIEECLKEYKATLAKSKNNYSKVNVKWHDEQLYTLFVLRFS